MSGARSANQDEPRRPYGFRLGHLHRRNDKDPAWSVSSPVVAWRDDSDRLIGHPIRLIVVTAVRARWPVRPFRGWFVWRSELSSIRV